MKKTALPLMLSICLTAGAAFAQSGGITESTDPARAAAVEQRARDLQANQNKDQKATAEAPKKKERKWTKWKKKVKSKLGKKSDINTTVKPGENNAQAGGSKQP